jgi:predicted secreted protein
MADEIPGINMIVAREGTAITDQTDATLSSTPEVAESVVKDTGFPNRLPADQDWTISLETQIPDSAGKDALVNGNAGLEVNVDATDDSTDNPQLESVEGIQSLTLTLDQDLQEVPPGISDATGWTYYIALRRMWEVDVDAHYYDPEPDNTGANVYEALHEARENGNSVSAELTLLGSIFSGDLVADDFELAAGTDDPASQSLPMMGTGAVSLSTNLETTIDGLIQMYFDQSTATVALQHEEGGSVVSPSTIWEGDAYLANAEITLERNAFPTLSAELQGTGPLSRVSN